MKKSKVMALTLAGAVAVTTLLAGTYAWKSVSQKAKNQVREELKNPGGRLHDDFNFFVNGNKDVYVENFTSAEKGGENIYARIRLDEYLEIGPNAGISGRDADKITVIKDPTAQTIPRLDYPDTWSTYKWEREKAMEAPNATAPSIAEETNVFRKYILWNQNGTDNVTTYLPTFNKNKDSDVAEINGTMEGKNGQPYDDNIVYEFGKEYMNFAVYDADSNEKDELVAAGLPESVTVESILAELTTNNGADWDVDKLTTGGDQGGKLKKITIDGNEYQIQVNLDGTEVTSVDVNLEGTTDDYAIKLVKETHKVQKTLENGSIMSMDKWIEKGRVPGNYWVYDTDGWVYWANPIEPSKTTSLLLDKIELRENAEVGSEYYYAINVVAQFTSIDESGEWTEFAKVANGKISENAMTLLNRAAGVEKYQVTIQADGVDGTKTLLDKGKSIGLNATVTEAAKSSINSDILWSLEYKDGGKPVSGTTLSSETGKNVTLTVSADETVGKVLLIKAIYTDENGEYGVGQFEVTVSEIEAKRAEIANIAQTVTTGTFDSDKKVLIDGQEWYVIATDNDGSATKALLYAASSIDYDGTEKYGWTETFGDNNQWEGSYIQKYLNGDSLYKGKSFPDKYPNAYELAEKTTIYTRKQIDADSFIESADKVFLLSEADMLGTFMGKYLGYGENWSNTGAMAKDYTVVDNEGKGVTLMSDSLQRIDNITGISSWLRSPRGYDYALAYIYTDGKVGASTRLAGHGLRPAFWVDISSVELGE